MQIGICGGPDKASFVANAGADYLEIGIRSMTMPGQDDATWKQPAAISFPIPAANSFIAPDMRLTGPDVDRKLIDEHTRRTVERAAKLGIRIIVFGSGNARHIPDGFPRDKAWDQLVEFGLRTAKAAANVGVMIVVEQLNRKECNVLTRLDECARLVENVGHPAFQLLLDTYHFWLEKDSLTDLEKRIPMIKHVHAADETDRVYPGESGQSNYGPIFSLLKSGGYDARISIEAATPPSDDVYARSVQYLRDAWKCA